ncbi:hypothetical protein PoB_006709200 [Plakobranchus ocellatus]|uniref:Uncharacterized protein n=1 Tax=Plakobranchus ocellatus TaxID=259542 RepID=A0AAV4D8W6_9GAST|nr:hypothetical protein PoB_006709200 [Plakobranchus ocellatus]
MGFGCGWTGEGNDLTLVVGWLASGILKPAYMFTSLGVGSNLITDALGALIMVKSPRSPWSELTLSPLDVILGGKTPSLVQPGMLYTSARCLIVQHRYRSGHARSPGGT